MSKKMEPNWDKVNEVLETDKKLFGNMSGFDFSIVMQNLLISEGGYVLDTGNWENVNYECACRLIEKIKQHPALWRTFMLA